jgi:hypothetical protein
VFFVYKHASWIFFRALRSQQAFLSVEATWLGPGRPLLRHEVLLREDLIWRAGAVPGGSGAFACSRIGLSLWWPSKFLEIFDACGFFFSQAMA